VYRPASRPDLKERISEALWREKGATHSQKRC
jgi:hypothetical protein